MYALDRFSHAYHQDVLWTSLVACIVEVHLGQFGLTCRRGILLVNLVAQVRFSYLHVFPPARKFLCCVDTCEASLPPSPQVGVRSQPLMRSKMT